MEAGLSHPGGAAFLAAVDWRQPWLQPLLAEARPLLQARNWRTALNARAAELGLRNHRALPLHFVAQEELPPGMAYESYISASGAVPTRDNLHDFFNALAWLTYPALKIALNALQAREIERAGGDVRVRGGLRDAATLFDENAALLLVRDPHLVAALREHRWQDFFLVHRAAFGRDIEIQLFGHALLEKLVSPYKAITAHAWVVEAQDAPWEQGTAVRQAWLAARVAGQVEAGFQTRDFTPLPLAGVPGWWPGQDAAFYADAGVFRPPRKKRCA